MNASRWFYFLCLFCYNFVSAGLLPDTKIYTGKNRYSYVKNLEIGNLVISSKYLQTQIVYNNISGIKLYEQASNTATLITLQSKNDILSSIVIGTQQRFCAQIDTTDDDNNANLFWIEAENLKENMQILGCKNEVFKVIDIQNIKLDNPTDLYEISLIPNNTFYILDSNNNRLLTHNISWLAGFFIVVGCGVLVGGATGAGITIYKSYVKKVKISTRTVAKGFLIGAATGGAIAAATYGGIWLGVKFMPILIKHMATAASYVGEALGASKPILIDTVKLAELLPTIEKINKAVFVGTVVTKAALPATRSGYNFINQKVEEFVDDIEKRDLEDIDLSGLYNERANSKRCFYNETYQKRNTDVKVFHSEPLIDENGNPFLDKDGNPINIIFAA